MIVLHAFVTVFGEQDKGSSLDTLLLECESRIVLYLCARHGERERRKEKRYNIQKKIDKENQCRSRALNYTYIYIFIYTYVYIKNDMRNGENKEQKRK